MRYQAEITLLDDDIPPTKPMKVQFTDTVRVVSTYSGNTAWSPPIDSGNMPVESYQVYSVQCTPGPPNPHLTLDMISQFS